ncbi:hypothetical protein [Lentzea sp. NPDC003310]|uniref:hypothetical protein n=1 Tax=Lentzea sp. NPDC003310 TaxID=3154447 RepID=UPI0033A118C0
MPEPTQYLEEFGARLKERTATIFAATSTDAAAQEPPPPAVAAAAPLCRVRVVLTGFRCIKQTWDHAFEVDGKADEVFVQAEMGVLDSTGPHQPWNRRTVVYGQNAIAIPPSREFVPTPWAGRFRAGSASPWGGVQTGDVYPPALPPWWQPFPPAVDRLPLLLFERIAPVDSMKGLLTVIPSIWEYDNGTPLDPSWGDAEARFIADLAKKFGAGAAALAPLFPVLGAFGAALATVGQVLPDAFLLAKEFLGQPGDRPIGQRRHSDGQRSYDPAVLLIDLAKATSAAAVQYGFGPGVYPIRRKDSGKIGDGEYDMFVKVTYELV